MDVCDDTEYSQRAKALHSKAAAAGVPAITTTGIYPGARRGCCRAACEATSAGRASRRLNAPLSLTALLGACLHRHAGVSNVMAAHMISTNSGEYAEDGSYAAAPPAPAPGDRPGRVLYSYFTAGACCCGRSLLPRCCCSAWPGFDAALLPAIASALADECAPIRSTHAAAGTGGAGPTILETTLLLAGEDVVAYK